MSIKRFKQDKITYVVILVVFILLGAFIVYPLARALIMSFTPDGSFSLEEYLYIFTSETMMQTFYNSIQLGVIVATFSTILGYIVAYSLTKVKLPARGFFRQFVMIPIISPPFMLTISIILLLGRNGIITDNLLGGLGGFSIYGLDGLIIVQTLCFYPIAYRTLAGVLSRISPDIENAALNLGSNKFDVFRHITFPLSLPGTVSAWLLVFVLSLADFANPMILAGGYKVLSVQAYMQFTGMYNLPRGAGLAMILLIPTLVAFSLQRYWVSKRSYITVTGKPSGTRQRKVSSTVRKLLYSFLLLLAGIIFLFYGTVIVNSFITTWGVDYSLTLEHIKYAWDVGLETIKDTVFMASVATPVTGILGMIIAFLIVRKEFLGKGVMEFTSMMSYGVPGTVVGIGYILAFNEKPLLLTGTATIIILNYIFRNVPVGIETGKASLEQIDPAIEESSTNLGANTAYTFSKITLPLIKPAFFSGLAYSFVRSMTAVSAIIFLVSARWNHLTVLTLSQTEMMRLGVASTFSWILIVIVLSVFYLMGVLLGEGGSSQTLT